MSLKVMMRNSPLYRWYILAIISVGTFMATLDSSIISVALPTISHKLNANLSILQWVVTAYLLTISSLLPIFGRIADLLGRKRVYSMGYVIFTLGSVLCGLAFNIWFLVAMRIIQAIGASMLMSSSAAIITFVFPPKERGRALGLAGTVAALGSLVGPTIGGLLVGFASWRAIFYINLPIGIIGYLASQLIFRTDIPPKVKQTFDFIGATLFTLGLTILLFAVSNGQTWGWYSTPILLGLILGMMILVAFFYTETHVKDPIIDLSLFRNRAFLAGNLSGLLSYVAMFSNVMLMPFYLQSILFYTPSQVGLLMTAFPLMMTIVAPISGYISDRIGPMFLTTGGLMVTALGLFYLSKLTSTSSVLQIIPGPILMGLGTSMFSSPNINSVMGSVPRSKLGIAGGINALVRNVGMVIGIAFSVSLFENRQASVLSTINNPDAALKVQAFMSAYHFVMLTAMGIAIVGALISLNRQVYISTEKSN